MPFYVVPVLMYSRAVFLLCGPTGVVIITNYSGIVGDRPTLWHTVPEILFQHGQTMDTHTTLPIFPVLS